MKLTIKKENLIRVIREETRKIIKESEDLFRGQCDPGLDHLGGRIVRHNGELACKFYPGMETGDLSSPQIVTFSQWDNGKAELGNPSASRGLDAGAPPKQDP